MNVTEQVGLNGFAVIEAVLPAVSVFDLIYFVEHNLSSDKQGKRGGVHNLLRIPLMRDLAMSEPLMSLVKPILGSEAHVVRGTLFDKTPDANWKVPWHQDVTIAVHNRCEIEGFGPWSIKDGVQHVQPPSHVMENMLSVRLHLDDCPAANGALRVVAGSHRKGKVSASEVEQMAATSSTVVCEVQAGGVVLMHPLFFHASSASKIPGHRRVIHFDYSGVQLPVGLQWHASASMK